MNAVLFTLLPVSAKQFFFNQIQTNLFGIIAQISVGYDMSHYIRKKYGGVASASRAAIISGLIRPTKLLIC